MVLDWLCTVEPGRQHGACSETFWASCIMLFVFPGKDGRVTGRTESLPESQMDYSHFLPLLSSLSSLPLSFMLFAGNSQHHWCGLFLCVAWEQRNHASLACHCRLFLPLFPLFILLSISPQAVRLPWFYLCFMIYFARLFDLCSYRVLSVTSKERFVLIISIWDSDNDKTRLDTDN